MIESLKPIFSMLGTPDDWLTAEERYFFLQPHHLRHLVNLNSRNLQKLHFGESTWKSAERRRFTELCRILKLFPAIERLGIVGIHDHQVEMTESLQNLAKAHQDLFRGIKELRIYEVFIPLTFPQRDIMALLSYLPNLHALTIPLRLENNTAKLLAKSCPYLKTIHIVLSQIHVNQLNYDQPWTCLGPKILRCQIAGIEHLDKFEQQRYDVLVQEGRHQLENTEQRTSYEDQIVELMQRSRRKHKLWGQTPAAPITLPNSLELSLASELDQLRSLKKLELFGMESMSHRMGKAELKWMVHHWPRLEQMHGLHADKSQEPEHEAIKTELRKYLQSLKPSIVHASQPVKQLKLQGSEVSLAFLLHTAVTPH
ncbi:hypothetical protein BG006_009549 [Podila minutissima]|uniref:Uncharacterized protein n=1 Tax=Podila minutissima TaxID=64525 RepID=A0A9P5SRM1_9FUNG|nr:hypothetical protein BG006_009549 [Podila minutissima]